MKLVSGPGGGQLRTSTGQLVKLAGGSSPVKVAGGTPGQKVIAIQRSAAGVASGGSPQVMQLIRTPQGALITPKGTAGGGVLKVVGQGAAAGQGTQLQVGKLNN